MRILHREEGFYVVEKPAGVLSQKDKSGAPDLASLLKRQLESRGEKVAFLAPVHRLDRNTSGLLILARNSESASELTELLKQGQIEKTYLAIVKGDPAERGRYDQPLRKDERKNQSFVDPAGDKALTEFSRIKRLGNSSLLEVRIHTGRPHQIRAHFAHGGHALLGDRKYGKKPWSEIFSRPALHAHRLVIPWAGQLIRVESPLPADMKELLVKLGG
jgi:23S rRNA pseudouridine1911/1915/1917 synthase